MKHISVFLIIVRLHCFICVHIGNVQQQSLSVQQFIPMVEGCNINWILDVSGGCTWFENILEAFMPVLSSAYFPSTVYDETEAVRELEKNAWNFDRKGTCFVKWSFATNFVKLVSTVKSRKFSQFRSDDWFLYIKVCITYIDQNFLQTSLYVKMCIVFHNHLMNRKNASGISYLRGDISYTRIFDMYILEQFCCYLRRAMYIIQGNQVSTTLSGR